MNIEISPYLNISDSNKATLVQDGDEWVVVVAYPWSVIAGFSGFTKRFTNKFHAWDYARIWTDTPSLHA